MVGSTVSHYRILEPLGQGGMGVVYKAEDTSLKRTVALKFLPPELTRDPDAKERFVHEAQAASALDHNNICVIHEVGESDDGRSFIVMAYYDGDPLKSKIEEGKLRVEDGIDIAIQIARGLSKAHEHGIIHRDIKPANIIVTKAGDVKIVDFGLAKLTGRTLLTRQGSTLGTVAYMSPEQARGDSVDARTDIWSLGIVLYEMITGRLPFKGDYDNAIIYSILNAEPEPMSAVRTGVPTELDRIVRKCLSKEPGERYQHVDELLVDLRSCAKGSAQAVVTTSRVPSRTAHKGKLGWYGLAIGVLALALIVYFLATRDVKPASHLKMIAVLPFENLGPVEDEYFTDGLTDEITSRLSGIKTLGVISRTSAMAYKKSTKPLPVIARELGVNYVLEGTIRWVKDGNSQRIRITPELIDVSDNVTVWADNLDRTLDDIFAIQTEIASGVARSLDIVLNESQRRLIESIPTKNLEAYQAYLRGLSFVDRFERTDLETAITLFQRSVDLDSTFATAYAQLSMAHLMYFWIGYDPSKERFALARKLIDRAFALKGDLPEAYIALGYSYLFGSRDYDRALEAFTSVEKTNPNNRMAIEAVAYIHRRRGKFQDAMEWLTRALALDPQNSNLVLELGNTERMIGNYPEAEEYLDRAISILPDLSTAYVLKAQISLVWHGDTRKSRIELEQIPPQYEPWFDEVLLDIYDRNYQAALNRLARAPVSVFVGNLMVVPAAQMRGMIYRFVNDTARSHAAFDSARVYLESEVQKRPDDYRPRKSLAIVYAGLGQKEAALREAETSRKLLPISHDAWAGVFPEICLAQVYAMIGMNNAACAQLEGLLSSHASKEISVSILRLDPIYDPLRNDPGFQKLLTKYQ